MEDYSVITAVDELLNVMDLISVCSIAGEKISDPGKIYGVLSNFVNPKIDEIRNKLYEIDSEKTVYKFQACSVGGVDEES